MKTLILLVLVLFLAGAALVHFFPEKVEPFVEQTPLKELVATSKPVYQWRGSTLESSTTEGSRSLLPDSMVG